MFAYRVTFLPHAERTCAGHGIVCSRNWLTLVERRCGEQVGYIAHTFTLMGAVNFRALDG